MLQQSLIMNSSFISTGCCSLLTLVSLLGLLATLLDYSVPLLTSKLAPAWTAEKEARLEKLARWV